MGEWVDDIIQYYPGGNDARDEVGRKFDDSYTRVTEAKGALDDYAASLESYLDGLHSDLDEDYEDNFKVEIPAPYEISGTFPEFNYDSWALTDSPENPALVDLDEIDVITLRDYPTSVVENPGFDIVQKPTFSVIEDPGNAPETDAIELPPTPEFELPDDVTIAEIEISDAPSVEVPAFNAVQPTDDLSNLTTPDFSYDEPIYASEVWTPLAAKMVDGIVNGGTGLDPDVEARLYDSGRYRQEVDEELQREKIKTKYASKGFDLPQGAQLVAEQYLDAESARNKTELNGQITINQANLAQANTHFFLEKGINLEQLSLNFFDAQQNRIMESKKIAADVATKAGQLLIERYNGRAQVYGIVAQAYESELKAAFADLEAYKIEMEGKKVASDVQKNVVAVYTAQVQALETRAKLYTAQVEGAKTAAEIERLKMEIYEIETKAYVAKYEAEKVKSSVYATDVESERVKAQQYGELVKAHQVEVDTIRAVNEGKIAKLNAQLSRRASDIDLFKAQIMGFDSTIAQIAKQHDVAIRRYDSETNRERAKASVVESQNNLLLKGVDASIAEQRLALDAEIARIVAIQSGHTDILNLEGKTRLGIYNAIAQLMASAMASVNASASTNDGMSRSYSASTSTSNSLSEQHSYNQSA